MSLPPPLSDGTKLSPVKINAMSTRNACTTIPASEFSTPELAATATF